jgi:hypothetical protein
MSIECTTSANSTVTCLYSAVSPETPVGAPHSPQNLAFSRSPVPHDPHATPAVIQTPPFQGPDRLNPTLDRCLGPGDVSFEAKLFRHFAIAPRQVPVGNIVAAGAG